MKKKERSKICVNDDKKKSIEEEREMFMGEGLTEQEETLEIFPCQILFKCLQETSP